MAIRKLKHEGEGIEQYKNLIETDSAGHKTIIRSTDQVELKFVLAGIPGATCLSIPRRLRDSRFATTYLKGDCIDVGGGLDSIQVYKDFFPLLKNVIIYDKEQGDAQYLSNVPDNEFDCLVSSHCLEHLYDSKEALKNWIRVVKLGGFLVITVPDEDLYERGHWPSRFNGDHKRSFTINKHRSWSKDSINVISLLQCFSNEVKIHKIELQDAGYHYNLELDIDQTRFATAECCIEIILQKWRGI
jgi:predicted SAM-dependent methyltransferase